MWAWSRGWRHFYRRALPAYWIFLFVSTHLPKLDLPGPRESDKLAHATAFAALAFFFWKFHESFGRPLRERFVWQAAAWLVAYAAVDEYLQQFVGRRAGVDDWLANVTGVALVLGVLEWLRRRQLARIASAGASEKP